MELLLGKQSPSGRLSQAWPRSAGYVHSQASPWYVQFHKCQTEIAGLIALTGSIARTNAGKSCPLLVEQV